MKLSPSSRKKQRRMLDRRLRELRPIASTPAPRTGWLRAVRQSLGMSAAQVAARLGLSAATVVELELREPAGKVSLQTLDRTARAMGCKLVYAVVPESSTSLEDMVHAQALRAARSICKRATQSMGLEKQEVDPEETEAQVEDLARSFMDKMSAAIWERE